MIRYIELAFLAVAAFSVTTGPALTAEATMQLRGSDLTFTGTVISFDGNAYVLETELFGKVNLDIRRFECVSGACSATVTKSATAQGPDFAIYGSSTIGAKLMPQLIGAYAQSIDARATMKVGGDAEEAKIKLTDNEGTKLASIELTTHGSDKAFSALAEGEVPIGISSRPIKADEANLLPSIREHILAYDGLIAIVSPQNSISAISIKQLASIFAGEISDWSELGLSPGNINVYARNEGSGTLETFNSLVFENANRRITPNAHRIRSDAELSDAVARDPRGVGFTSFAYKRSARPLDIASDCGITYSPLAFDVKTEEYPLSRHLFLYTNLVPGTGHAAAMLKYVLSDQAQQVVSGAGFINQSLQYLPFKLQGARIIRALDATSESFNLKLIRQMIKEIGEFSRLSIAFRFRPASFTLERHSEQKIQRLVAALSSDQLRDKDILLLGFSDSVGAFDQNRELSVIRAREVKQQILRIAGGRIDGNRLKESGYGELLPIGCNEDPHGRALNRRVEVWIKATPATSAENNVSTTPSAEQYISTAPSAEKNVSTAPSSAKNPDPQGFTADDKVKLFRDFLQWQSDQSN